MSKSPNKNTNIDKPKNFKKTFKKLIHNLKKYWLQIIIGLICAVVSNVLAIIGPDKIQEITVIINQEQIEFTPLTKVVISLLIIYLTSFLFSFLQSFIMSGVTARIGKDYRSDISKKINNLPLKYLDNTPNGDILSRMTNDVDLLSETLNSSISSIITCIATVVGSIIMMLKYSWKVTIIAVLVVPLSILIISILVKLSQKYFQKQQRCLGEINGHIEEIYSGHNVISVYNGQEMANEKFDRINEEIRESSFKGNILSGLMHPIMNFISNMGYVLILVISGIIAIDDPEFLYVIIPFLIYYRMFNNQISQVASISSTLQTTVAASERVYEFLEEKSEPDESEKTTTISEVKGNIKFDSVNFGYLPEKQILFDLNLDIKKGQKVAVVGATGAGKTTLVNLLMRFYQVDSGSITIDGVDINNLKREEVRKLFGMVLQDTWLFEGTIKENIAYGKENVTDEDIINICKYAGIHHLIMSQPKGYDMLVTEESNFSAGEKQLITIARAMLHDAPMLILDEATSSVDTRTEVLIQNAMDKLLKNRTSIIIAHRLSTIVNADKIIVMKDGRVAEEGKHEDLLKLGGIYAGLYKSQF